MKITKYIGIGSAIWMVVFLIDYIYELFQINKNGVVTTFSGLRITTEMTKAELNTQFSLTWQALIMYILFLVIWVGISLLISSRKRKDNRDH